MLYYITGGIMGVSMEQRRRFSPTYLPGGQPVIERLHTLEEYAQDHFR